MKIFVTGGAGFIGSNFIRQVLSLRKDYKIVNYDKLTYAGNLANLDSVADNPNYSFVRGDICDAAALEEAMQRLHGCRALCGRVSRRPQHLRACPGHRNKRDRHVFHAASGAKAEHRAIRPHFHR